MRVVIADTSCLIIYEKIDNLNILKDTFQELIVTEEVAEEYGELPKWIKVKRVGDRQKYLKLNENLGKGEASSIVLASETRNSILIIDEKKGRKIAREFNIEIIGSLGVLLKAKKRGVIKSVREIVEKIEQTNFRISKSIKDQLIKQAKE